MSLFGTCAACSTLGVSSLEQSSESERTVEVMSLFVSNTISSCCSSFVHSMQ